MIDKKFYNQKITKIKISELLTLIESKLFNQSNNAQSDVISGIETIAAATESELCFLTNKKYLNLLQHAKSKYCLIEADLIEDALKHNNNINYIISEKAYSKYAFLLEYFYAEKYFNNITTQKENISSQASIGKNCKFAQGVIIANNSKIGDNVTISANSYIGPGVTIGDNTNIGANTVITYAKIGSNVEIMHNVSIGQDGFGFAFDGKKHKKIIQLGLVIIEDNVSIGSNVSIDRGSMENTIIGLGSKIDNLVQIAHNVVIGKFCLLTAQVGIAGSTKLGDFVVCGGQTGIAGHLNIGSHNRFAAQSGVTKNIIDNQGDFYGMPAIKKKDWQKENIALRKITNQIFNKK